MINPCINTGYFLSLVLKVREDLKLITCVAAADWTPEMQAFLVSSKNLFRSACVIEDQSAVELFGQKLKHTDFD